MKTRASILKAMMVSLSVLSVWVVFAENLPLPPQPKKLTLHDAVWLALRYNPTVENNQIQRVVQKYNLVVARNNFELQYALTGSTTNSYTRSLGSSSNSSAYVLTPSTSLNLPSGGNINVSMPNNLTSPNSGGTYNPSLTVTMTQHLMRGFGSEITLTPLANQYDAERINKLTLRQTIIATIVMVIGDYYAVIQDKENLQAQALSLKNIMHRLQENELKIKDGKSPPSDNVQDRADLAQAKLNYTSAENTLLQAKLKLLTDIGLSPDENIEVEDQLDSIDYPLPSNEDAQEKVLANDTSYQTALINRRVDMRALSVAQDDERAQLDLTVSGTTGGTSGNGELAGVQSLTNGSNQTGSVGLSLTVPIDDVQTKANTLSAKAKIQQDDITLRAQQWQLETNTINAINNLKTLKTQLGLAKTAVDEQQKALELTEIKQKYGLSSVLDVSLQQTALTNTRLNYISTKINYLSTMLQFRQLLGETLEDWHVQVRY